MRRQQESLFGQMRTGVLYARALLFEFRWTLLLLAIVMTLGTALYMNAPSEFGSGVATPLGALYASWMAMLAQPLNSPPGPAHLKVLAMVYPVVGFIVIGEGVVRLALLLFSKRQGMTEWTRVMASTYRDHIVLCGLGRMGIRVLEQLLAAGVKVVVIEKDVEARHIAEARQSGTPVIIGDMKDDATLQSAGVEHARAVVIATNDDMANLEVALDSRRMNPRIRVVMRLFEQQIAQKVANAFLVDAAFSASTLAAPMVAAMSLGAKVMSSSLIANIPHVTAEVTVAEGSALVGERIDGVERSYACKVLAQTPAEQPTRLPPMAEQVVQARDVLVVHVLSAQLGSLSAAAQEL